MEIIRSSTQFGHPNAVIRQSRTLVLGVISKKVSKELILAVKVDSGGYGISWNDDADLSEYELWTNGVEVAMAEKR